jgi:hypothetical protein
MPCVVFIQFNHSPSKMVEVKQLRHNDVLGRHLQDQWQTAKYKLPESMSAVYIIETLDFIHCHKHESEPL